MSPEDPMTPDSLRWHHITTMAELVAAATDENIDALSRDLGEWLRWHLAMRHMDALGVTMQADAFVWTDDGKPGPGTVTIHVDPDPAGDVLENLMDGDTP